MTQGDILAPAFLVSVGLCLYLVAKIEHRRFVRSRDARRAAQVKPAE